jgi:ferredoxin
VVRQRAAGTRTPPDHRHLTASAAMPYQISVNRELCASNAECVSLAPEVFELDDEELCVVFDPEGAKDKRILLAARACPVDAITLVDATGEQVWP